MRIVLIEPFFTGSHAAWAREYARCSRHRVDLLDLGGQHWKWRMHGGAVTLARRFLQVEERPDLLLATDMLDLTVFLALTRARTAGIPVALYFHENQIGYPWSARDRDVSGRPDLHYGFINYSSALAADWIFFNSDYHRRSFMDQLPAFLGQFPDHREPQNVALIRDKSTVLPLGIDLKGLDAGAAVEPAKASLGGAPLILWNHRWEHDKNPEDFFRALFVIHDRGLDFRLAILGESYGQRCPVFNQARRRLAPQVVHCGYVKDAVEYAGWLWRADILPVTSRHDFFGASLVQALYCGVYPLLPRRLSYPELVPVETYPEVFYTDFEDLVEKLAGAIREIGALRRRSFRHCVAGFDWGAMGPVYDEALEELARRHKER